MSYTERFTEVHYPLGLIPSEDYTMVQYTEYVSLANYHRAVAVIHFGTLNGPVNAGLQQASDTAGTGVKAITGKTITALTATDDEALVAIELRTEELDVDGGFDCVRLYVTPTANAQFSAVLYGIEPRFMPTGTTNWTEVVD